MPLRSIKILYKSDSATPSCNDPHAETAVNHTLVPDERYLVSPIQSNKDPKFRGRSCIFLKSRRVKGGAIRARVRFEDDGSESLVDPGDLLPYGEELPVSRGYDEGVACELNPEGAVSDKLQCLRQIAFDLDADLFRDKFRFLVGAWFCARHESNGSADPDFIADLNRRLYQMIGPGHHVQSCVQFMQGAKGRQAFNELNSHALK